MRFCNNKINVIVSKIGRKEVSSLRKKRQYESSIIVEDIYIYNREEEWKKISKSLQYIRARSSISYKTVITLLKASRNYSRENIHAQQLQSLYIIAVTNLRNKTSRFSD